MFSGPGDTGRPVPRGHDGVQREGGSPQRPLPAQVRAPLRPGPAGHHAAQGDTTILNCDWSMSHCTAGDGGPVANISCMSIFSACFDKLDNKWMKILLP